MQSLNATPSLLALTLSIPLSVWWFSQMSMMSPLPGPGLTPTSLQALLVFLGVQVSCLCLFGPLWQMADQRSPEPHPSVIKSMTDSAAFLLPTLPLLAMLGYATGVSLARLGATQVFIFAIGTAVAVVARLALMRISSPDAQRLVVTSIGALAATVAWSSRSNCFQWAIS